MAPAIAGLRSGASMNTPIELTPLTYGAFTVGGADEINILPFPLAKRLPGLMVPPLVSMVPRLIAPLPTIVTLPPPVAIMGPETETPPPNATRLICPPTTPDELMEPVG